MTQITDLSERSLRRRIDGINFTLIIPHEERLINSESSLSYDKETILISAVSKVTSILKADKVMSQRIKSKITLDLNDCFGIYVELFFKEVDLFIIIQFKGAFFTKDNSFLLCRTTMLHLVEKMGGLFRITTVDLAQDFNAKIWEIFPDPTKSSFEYKYCFKFKFRRFVESRVNESVETGYEFFSSRYKLIVYDKLRENRRAKNPRKKKYYDDLYRQYNDTGVTRVEIRLKQELCKDLATWFYDLNINEEDFIDYSVSKFFNKHKLRDRPPKSKDSDYRRWPINLNWKFVFSSQIISCLSKKTEPDYLFTTPNKNIAKIMHQLVEALANNYPEKPKAFLQEVISNIDIDPILVKTEHRIRTRESSRLHLERIKEEILLKNKDLFEHDINSLGVTITSPVERKPNENLDT